MNTARELRVVSVSNIQPDYSIRRKMVLETIKRQNALQRRRLFIALSVSALLVALNTIAIIHFA